MVVDFQVGVETSVGACEKLGGLGAATGHL